MELRSGKKFKEKDLEELFLSVEWKSGKRAVDLKKAMQGSDTVLSAWDGEKLVGMINAVSDRTMVAFFPYLLVRPDYQGKGVGKALLLKMLEIYDGYFRRTLICYNDKVEFYQKHGFIKLDDQSAMSIEPKS
ncbi:MAG: GNAT family N-acetyltransferase [Oscillospiraceae bacterium]|jgi:GNAT superfamily N-acetyltransferase